ncbi:MAG TPA: GntR family transcriptional regulator [Xanthomonadaceae bacterium]|nr:GntR family transcriptional regulator [Xanthomonadaceae bacterium]
MDASVFLIAPASPDPIYRQIVEQVRRFVAAGQIRVGEGLPSVREMAEHHAVNPMTVSRAYSQLEAEGVLVRRRGVGMVVAEARGAGLTAEERLRLLEPRLRDVIREAGDLGLAAGPVCERLHALFLTPVAV